MSFDSSVTNITVAAPTLSVNVMVVGADLTAPAPSINVGMLVPAIGYILPPAPTIEANWIVGGEFSADITAPAPTIESNADGIWSVVIECATGNISVDWILGGSFTLSLVAPAPKIQGASDAGWKGAISAPAPSISARMYLEQLWAAAIEATAPDLDIAFLEITNATYNEDTDEWEITTKTWCVNSENTAHSVFTNYDFNSYARFNGQDIALRSDGVFTLGGDTDDGDDIDAKVIFAPSNFATGVTNRIDSAYINVRGATALSLVTVFDEEVVRTYNMDFSNDQRGVHRKRCKVGKGLKGTNVQIGVENRDGSNFDIESMEVVVVPLKRKA